MPACMCPLFFDLTSLSGLTNQQLSSMLDLSFKTIQRYKKENKKLYPG